MHSLSIKARLTLLVAGLLVLLLMSSASTVLRLKASNAALETVYNDRVVPLKQLKTVADGYGVGLAATAQKVSVGAMPASVGAKAIADAEDRIHAAWKDYTSTYLVPKEKELVALGEPLLKQSDAAAQRMRSMMSANDLDGLRAFVARDMFPLIEPVTAVMDQLTNVQLEVAEREFTASEATYRQVLWTNVIVSAAALVVAATLAWLLVRSITRGIGEAVTVAETVAAGDLRSRIVVTRRDETGQLLSALKRMNDSLVDIVGQVRNASDSIATGSSQIATGNADLSQRTEEQASNLQQTAASMEQLTATVKQNADTARQATQLASGASTVAEQGGTVVGQVVATMEDISASSRKISDIIGVIDGIAFQTNILALNAAVEAARAGEQGRGFAVVAGEVRTLAQRSAQAAREIKQLIGQSVEKVDSGSRLVVEAGSTMNDIVNQVKRVSDLIGEISATSLEQSGGIGQIGDAVQQLDQVTQQNAALVEQSAAAAESLKHQAAQLAHTVSTFKLAHA